MSRRDRRFVAAHRGGPLDRESHAFLAVWAAACAERVLVFYDDPRLPHAIETARAWAKADVKTGIAMKAAVAAHAAARESCDKIAIAAARSAGHAVATAHAADHCMGALLYAMKALALSGTDFENELEHRLQQLPPHLLDPVAAGIEARLGRFVIRNSPPGNTASPNRKTPRSQPHAENRTLF